MKAFVLVLLGLAHAALCQTLALGMAGAGHGWIAPFFVAFGGFVLFPISFASGFEARSSMTVLLCGTIGALLLDGWLWLQTLNEGIRYFEKVGEVGWIWLALWLGGQLPLLIRLAMRVRRNKTA